MMTVWAIGSVAPRRLALMGIAAAVLMGGACSRGPVSVVKKVEPATLSELALAPADFGDMYSVNRDSYLDDDGNRVKQPTRTFLRQMQAKNAKPDAGSPAQASVILVTVGDLGVDKASEFVETADDDAVGPPNLADYIQQKVPGSSDVHAELIPDFPTYGDDTVANRITWQQSIDGQNETVDAFGVYIRSGGLLALVSLRASADPGGGVPEGLYQQTETAAKRQAEKLKGSAVALIGPSR